MQADVVGKSGSVTRTCSPESDVALFRFGGGCVDLQWREGELKKVEVVLRPSYTQRCLWPMAFSRASQKLTDL